MDPNAIKDWLGQSTTIQGSAGILAILSAAMSGQMTWQNAVPAMVGALILVIWPQQTGLAKQATTVTTDVEAALPLVLKAYSTGLQHGVASVPVPVAAPVAPPPAPPAAPVQPVQ